MKSIWIVLLALAIALAVAGLIVLFRWYAARVAARRVAAYQNSLLGQHFDEIQNIYRQMRGWRHDFHNHIQVLLAQLALGDTAQMEDYLRNLDADLTAVDTVVKTGNVMLDAILNSKLSLAAARHIAVDATAYAPPDLRVPDVDLCVILGNLLDNAMEACARLEESQRFIRVYIGPLKNKLYINVTNAMAGQPKKQNGRYATTKSAGGHGFGLERLDRVAARNGGFVNRQHEEGVFATEVILETGD